MRIAFLLPGRSVRPSGGFKVVYEYANRLVDRGHRVSVVHPWDCDRPASARDRLRSRLWTARYRLRPGSIVPWLELDDRVSMEVVPYPRRGALPDADALIATAWQTAGWVAGARGGRGGGFYLIQGYETWDEVEAVRATWRLPLHKIVISSWLEQIAIEMGEGTRTSLVRNGVDLERFGIDVPPAERALRVGALLSPFKRPEDVVGALSLARDSMPGLSASLFGAGRRPPGLPEWVEYVRGPSPAELRAFYNNCSIFLQASDQEGWGLPATESMACGCALVTYDNGGSREYAADGETALVVEQRTPQALAAALVRLGRGEELRLRLAAAGRARVEGFTWTRAVSELELAIGATAGRGE